MKRSIYLIVFLLSATMAHGDLPSSKRHFYVKNITHKIHALNKKIDQMIHKKAFENSQASKAAIQQCIHALRYQRDILMIHKRTIDDHGFEKTDRF